MNDSIILISAESLPQFLEDFLLEKFAIYLVTWLTKDVLGNERHKKISKDLIQRFFVFFRILAVKTRDQNKLEAGGNL